MTNEEIIREWKWSVSSGDLPTYESISKSSALLDLCRRVREREREEAAKMADRYREAWRTTVKMDNSHHHHKEAAEKIAAMIRNRKDSK